MTGHLTDTDHAEATADTMQSSDYTMPSLEHTHVSAWSSSPLGDPAAAGADEPTAIVYSGPHPMSPTSPPKSLGKAPLAALLVGVASACAALGVVMFAYMSPAPQRPVVVASGAISSPASPAPATALPPAANMPAPAADPIAATTVTAAPAAVSTRADSRPAPVAVAPAPPPVEGDPPADSGPAPTDPGPAPAPPPAAPVVVVDLPVPQLPAPPQVPAVPPLPPLPPPPSCTPPQHLVFGVCI